MSVSYKRGFRSVYALSVHIVFVTKYRQKAITPQILHRLHEIFSDLCWKWSAQLRDFNGENDHVHLIIDYPPDVRLSELVNNFKAVSSRRIRQEFKQHVSKYFFAKPVFWTASYFVASCGGVTLDQLTQYVEKQKAIPLTVESKIPAGDPSPI